MSLEAWYLGNRSCQSENRWIYFVSHTTVFILLIHFSAMPGNTTNTLLLSKVSWRINLTHCILQADTVLATFQQQFHSSQLVAGERSTERKKIQARAPGQDGAGNNLSPAQGVCKSASQFCTFQSGRHKFICIHPSNLFALFPFPSAIKSLVLHLQTQTAPKTPVKHYSLTVPTARSTYKHAHLKRQRQSL